jgi:tetratricopeptide (TPR) repeat protein
MLSDWYLHAGQGNKALAVYEEQIDRAPDQVWLYEAVAELYREMRQPERAIAAYQRIGALHPRYADYVQSRLETIQWSLIEQLPALPLVYSGATDMVWWPTKDAWVKPAPYPSVVVLGKSDLPVEGDVLPNQVLLHPFTSEQATRFVFAASDNPYAALQTSYALADNAAGKSNGVEYRIEISTDAGQNFAPLVYAEVTQSTWLSETVSLANYLGQDLMFKVTASALGNYSYDWLQVDVRLLPDAEQWSPADPQAIAGNVTGS